VVGPVTASATAGNHPNTATAHGTYGGAYTDSSDAAYYTTTLGLNKTVTETAFKAGDTLHYNYAVTNPDATHPLLGPVTVNDVTVPGGTNIPVTCPALSTIGNKDDYLDFGETLNCTATYTATAADVTAMVIENKATAKIGSVTSNESSQTVPLIPDLSVAKINSITGIQRMAQWCSVVPRRSSGR